jgi:hypothetical protein
MFPLNARPVLPLVNIPYLSIFHTHAIPFPLKQYLQSEIDARIGKPEILIKQVILYHELECNYDDSRLEEDPCPAAPTDPKTMTITSHHPDQQPRTTVTVINEDRTIVEGERSGVLDTLEFFKKSKPKSKSQLSLSSLEINVLSHFLSHYSVVEIILLT